MKAPDVFTSLDKLGRIVPKTPFPKVERDLQITFVSRDGSTHTVLATVVDFKRANDRDRARSGYLPETETLIKALSELPWGLVTRFMNLTTKPKRAGTSGDSCGSYSYATRRVNYSPSRPDNLARNPDRPRGIFVHELTHGMSRDAGDDALRAFFEATIIDGKPLDDFLDSKTRLSGTEDDKERNIFERASEMARMLFADGSKTELTGPYSTEVLRRMLGTPVAKP